MENGTQNQITKDYTLPASILVSAMFLAGAWIYPVRECSQELSNGVYTTELKTNALQKTNTPASADITEASALERKVLPPEGIVIPIRWGDLGIQMINAGVIDPQKFKSLYAERGGLDKETQKLLSGSDNGNLKLTQENSGITLNLLWALGLGNKNNILESGPMMDPRYGGAGNFASTGGWTLAQGNAMDHYNSHSFVVLTPEQQQIVERVAKNIYRPCCGNSTYFPDCNHGMAMLGLLELMASQGISEEKMYKVALQVNAYWFPDTYLTIATYMKNKGVDWNNVNPQEILGSNFSSASGYAQIASQVVQPQQQQNGGHGCGVDSGEATTPQQQSGCGI